MRHNARHHLPVESDEGQYPFRYRRTSFDTRGLCRRLSRDLRHDPPRRPAGTGRVRGDWAEVPNHEAEGGVSELIRANSILPGVRENVDLHTADGLRLVGEL